MIERNERLMEELLQAYNLHDPDRAANLCAPDYEGIDVGRAEPHRGPDGMRAALADYVRAFPDLHIMPVETISENNRVVQVWTASGTHRGLLMNIPPTGRQVRIHGVSVMTLSNGKVQRGYYIWDVAGLLRSIGLLPEL
jgi:steroid delta-isomerase-like uncharacterized protein